MDPVDVAEIYAKGLLSRIDGIGNVLGMIVDKLEPNVITLDDIHERLIEISDHTEALAAAADSHHRAMFTAAALQGLIANGVIHDTAIQRAVQIGAKVAGEFASGC